MRVCVIGAGFFGLHVANQIQNNFPNCTIDVLEAQPHPFGRAAFNNQCRLHMGFHYPRSGYTIYQSILGYDRFVKYYSAACNPIKLNLYSIFRDGHVSADQYFAVMDAFHLDYRHVKAPVFLKKQSEIEAIIAVPEQWIELSVLRTLLINQFNGNIICNTPVSHIDSSSGTVYVESERFNDYDFIINASYSNLNLGATEEFFSVKYELAALVNCKTNLDKNTAVTIMDGPFVSVYPSSESTHTLSSVIHTPMIKTEVERDFQQGLLSMHEIAKDNNVENKIIGHVKQFLDIEIEDTELWLSPKIKLSSDHGDSRVTEVKREGRLMSVLCGKLDAAFSASDEILRQMGINQ